MYVCLSVPNKLSENDTCYITHNDHGSRAYLSVNKFPRQSGVSDRLIATVYITTPPPLPQIFNLPSNKFLKKFQTSYPPPPPGSIINYTSCER